MTLHQDLAGTSAEWGEVGFVKGAGILLLFPQSLKAFEGKRIIGIKYDLLAQPEAPEKEAEGKKSPAPAKPAAREPKQPVKKAVVEKLVAETKKDTAPPNKLVQFPPPVATPPPDREELTKQLSVLRAEVEKALEALSNDKPVAAYKILEKLTKS